MHYFSPVGKEGFVFGGWQFSKFSSFVPTGWLCEHTLILADCIVIVISHFVIVSKMLAPYRHSAQFVVSESDE